MIVLFSDYNRVLRSIWYRIEDKGYIHGLDIGAGK